MLPKLTFFFGLLPHSTQTFLISVLDERQGKKMAISMILGAALT